jgi:hypothetical protein
MGSERRKTFSGRVEHEGPDESQIEHRLELLGARLQREAARLAVRYPAQTSRRVVPLPERRWSATAVRGAWLAAVALVLLFLPSLVNRWQQVWRPEHPLADASLTGNVAADTAVTRWRLTAPSTDVAGHEQAVSSHAATVPTEIESPVFLLEVSDPELEALLDLWETDRTEPTRLSI